ncbi:TPA: hypothetical protein EYP44_00970 [Candidatus Bathyarchaeota archaeon]|nr:hypothetical protein [Candidatus Bathyarchaeota archaeon]
MDALAATLNAFLREIKMGPKAVAEGNRVITSNKAFCPIMVSALSLGIPWDGSALTSDGPLCGA